MTDGVRLPLQDAHALASRALRANRTSAAAAESTARALLAAEADGQSGHGLSRVPSYAAQARAGKVNGFAEPRIEQLAPGTLRVDAGLGFAYPALELAIDALVPLAASQGIALALIAHSHHFGQAGAQAERLAERGLLALVAGNTPRAMAFWGGTTPRLGTNPLAFAAPLPDGPPLVLDMALSVVARSRIVAAQKSGQAIPSDWAVDGTGRPTTDPAGALAGALSPIGGAKGAALALMIEILCGALTASHFGWEADSFLDSKGAPPDVGQILIAIDPARSGRDVFAARMSALVSAYAADSGTRLPGTRRLANRERAGREGVLLAAALHAEIAALGS